MNMKRTLFWIVGPLALVPITAALAVSANGDTPMLDTLERGMWQLRSSGNNEPTTKICLGKPESLLQIRHSGLACEQYVVRTTENSVTVSYTCKGEGQGLTTIRKESNRIVHIQSQGIRDNAPFSFSVEGRKTGTC
ncbi:hypothetical protein [Sphingorhabdus sp.]|uniref:hypothetical protein n=1 Tax=Sphingorhabdus sp. TaxID=1902408 RepID=UPI00398393C2